MQMPQFVDPIEVLVTGEFPRGCLIDFRCRFDGKQRCHWKAIYHGTAIVHTVGMRRSGPWFMAKIFPGDKVSRIPHGYKILRDLDEQ